MKFILLALIIGTTLFEQQAFGQYFYTTLSGDTPGGLNQDPAEAEGNGQLPSWNSILGPSVATPTWSVEQTIPFIFNFNGALVSSYKVSSTGVLTFTTTAVTVPSSTPASLPDAVIPDNSICVWGLTTSGTNDNIATKTFGSVGSQQEWIHFSSCANGTLGWSYWSIVLEEGTDNIYIVNQRNSSGTGALSIGIQIDGITAILDPNSPTASGTAGSNSASIDDFYYEFIYGTQQPNEVKLLSFDILPYIGVGATNIEGVVKNAGLSAITTLTVNWDDGTGPYTDNITGLNILSNEEYNFISPTTLNAAAGIEYTIDLGVSIVGDVDLTNNTSQKPTVSLTQIPVKYVVGEEKTGTWCGWCPKGAVGLASMESVPNFIGIAVHNGSSDPMVVSSYDGNIGTYIPGGYPKGGVDRVANGSPDFSSFLAMYNERAGDIVPCDVKNVTAVYNAQTDEITVYAESEWFGAVVGDYRFSCIIVEDDLVGDGSPGWEQVNYYDGYPVGTMQFPAGMNNDFDFSTGGTPTDPSLFGGYDHVARYLSSNDILGDSGSLPADTVPMGLHSHTFDPIPANVINNGNKSHAIVMIVNTNTGEILNAAEVAITGSLDVTELDNSLELKLYPNPAANQVNLFFKLQDATDATVTIKDALGSTIMSSGIVFLKKGNNDVTIDSSALANGIYFVNIIVGNQVKTQMLSVVH